MEGHASVRGIAPRPPVRRKAGAPPAPPASAVDASPRVEPQASAPAPEDPPEVYEGIEIRDAWEALFEALEESFGPEFRVEPKKLDRMGERWARMLNKFAKSAATRIIASGFAKFFLALAVLQPVTILVGASFKRIKRARREAAEREQGESAEVLRARRDREPAPKDNVTQIGPRVAPGGANA